ncbi:MAG: NAD(P)H-dependent oxidoreductase subunit E, partial [Nitrospiraceae bacterium]
RIARGLNLTPAQIHSIVSFYSFFTMKPRGDHNIRICLGTACYVKRVEESLNKIKDTLKIDVGDVTEDRKFSLETVRCLGACGLAPVMVIDEETYGAVTPKKVLEIIKEYAGEAAVSNKR